MLDTFAFLYELEALIPPPDGCHHVLMVGQYGSDPTGWEHKLILQVNKYGKFYPFMFDEYDMNKPSSQLVAEVVEEMRKSPLKGWQISDTAGTPGKAY